MRVLVVNAGSSSLKLRLLDGDALEAERDLRAGRRAGARRGARASWPRPTPSATGSCTAARASARPVRVDDDVVAALRRARRPRAAAPAGRSAGIDAVGARAARRARRRVLRHRLPRDAAAGGRDLRRCRGSGASASGCAASASTACRTRTRSRRASCWRRAALRRHLPSRRGRVAGRRPRRRQRRHDDGLHAARGPGDGHALGQRRSRARAVAPAPRARRRRRRARRSSTSRGLLGLAGDGGHARAARPRDDADARLALDVYVHRLRAAIAAMAAALGGVDALVFTGGVGEHAPRDPRAHGGRTRVPRRRRSTPRPTRRATADAEIGAPGAPARTLVVTAREDLEVARQVRELLRRPPQP